MLQARNFWLFWEKNIKRQRLEQKYTTLLSKAVAANVLDAKEAFNDAAENSDIVYAMQSYASIPDSTIEVSKSEIEKLYNQRKELYSPIFLSTNLNILYLSLSNTGPYTAPTSEVVANCFISGSKEHS